MVAPSLTNPCFRVHFFPEESDSEDSEIDELFSAINSWYVINWKEQNVVFDTFTIYRPN